MNRLHQLSKDALAAAPSAYIRPLYSTIAWDESLVALLGTRGVGKTTLLLQRLKSLDLPPQQALYVDLGDLHFQQNRLFDFCRQFIAAGGAYLFIDKVHRYGFQGDWAQELVQVYDLYRKDVKLAFTGSSAVRILGQRADLSRRVLQHRIPGLSFREYLKLKHNYDLPVCSIVEILSSSVDIADQLIRKDEIRPLAFFSDYLRSGYYPYGLETKIGYLNQVNETVQLVLESDLPAVLERGEVDYNKISRLLYAIASSVPFQPNISKLSERLSLSRETIVRYLSLLEQADILINLRQAAKGISALSKPDKIYLNNTNLLFALAPTEVNVGTIRETFFANQLSYLKHERHVFTAEIRLPKKGDFLLKHRSGDYLFEIGGPQKQRQQIGTEEHCYAVVDSDITDDPKRIPLWMFGLLY